MLALALTLAVAAPQARPGTPVETPSAASAPAAVQPLDTPAQARALCDALTLPERLRTKGNAVERARASAEHEARREAALNGRYRVTIPAERLRFAPYEPDEKLLALSERVFLSGAGGALHVWTLENQGLPVTVDTAAAERVMQAAQRRTLALRLTFTLPDDDEEAFCAHATGARSYALGIDPASWEYVDGAQVLARGGEGGDRPVLTAAEGARPRVDVSDPVGEGGREVKRAVLAKQKDLEGCYQRALQQNPGLDGSLVAEVDLAAEGARAVHVAADSLQDEGMTSCVRSVLSGVEFPRGAGERAEIPIHFLLEAPAASGGMGSGRQ
jgi:hypothetical protein